MLHVECTTRHVDIQISETRIYDANWEYLGMYRRTHKISKFMLGKYAVKMLTWLVCFKISSSQGFRMVINTWFLQTPALLRRPEGVRSLELLNQ
jgi:hypothetical protein